MYSMHPTARLNPTTGPLNVQIVHEVQIKRPANSTLREGLLTGQEHSDTGL